MIPRSRYPTAVLQAPSSRFHLYGPDQSNGDPIKNPGMGALCKTSESEITGPCGVPMKHWSDNGENEFPLPNDKFPLPGGVHDFFYRYGPLHGDEKCSDGTTWKFDKPNRCDERTDPKIPKSARAEVGYFGYKVLGVSYGGRIRSAR